MALAELTSGCSSLERRESRVCSTAGDVLLSPSDALRRWVRPARRELESPRRCRMERRDIDGADRYVVENWRRAPAGAVRRIVL